MKNSTKNRKKKLLALLLSAMTAFSITSFVACKDDGSSNTSSSESSTEEESTETSVSDNGPIKNAGFEVFNTNDGLNVIGTSVSSWGKSSLYSDGSYSAPSSKAASGIIDTGDAWDDLTGSYYVENGEAVDVAAADKLIEALSETDAISLWDNFTTRDKLKYYEVWKDANDSGDISTDFDKYEAFNAKLIDLPDTVNPGTHHTEDEKNNKDAYPNGFNDHNVLMIHNKNPESDEGEKVTQSIGSAQKFVSQSTVTVTAGAAAEISVWVKTQDLMCHDSDGKAQEAVDKGAYISLAQTVGGTVMPVYEVKNINTKYMDLESTNGWKQYTFYVKGSSYADTTLTLTLGFGQGTTNDHFGPESGLVNGYAFFDDIQCNIFSQAAFDGKVENLSNKAETATFESPKALKTIDVSKDHNEETSYAQAEDLGYVEGKGFDVFPIDFYGGFDNAESVLGSYTAFATKSEDGKTSMAGTNDGNVTMPTLEGGRDGSNDVIEAFDSIAKIAEKYPDENSYVNKVYNKYFNGVNSPNLNGENGKVLLIMSVDGVAYTVNSNHEFTFKDDEGIEHEYMAVSFFVRTSNMHGYEGASVTLTDGNTEASISSIDTTNITPVNIGLEDTDDYQEDIYDGWQQCIFFVKNDTGSSDATFKLQFNFGPTTIDENSSLNSFQTGFAAFTNVQTLYMSEDQYESVNAGSYMKVVTLAGETEVTAAGNSGFDTAGNKSETHPDGIDGGLALLQNYKGVYSNSDYVTDVKGNKIAINSYANAGLLNRTSFIGTAEEPGYYYSTEYEEYKTWEFDDDDTTNAPEWFKGILKMAGVYDNKDMSAADVWKAAFGDATQPLFIWNDGVTGDGTSDDETTKDNNNYSYGFFGSSTTLAANSTTAISVRVKVGSTVEGQTPTAHIYLVDTSTDSRTNILSIGASATYWYDSDGNVYAGDPEDEKYPALFLQDNGLYTANPKWSGYKAEMADKYYANLNAYTDKDDSGNLLVAANGGVHDYVSTSDYVKVKGEKRAIAFYYNKDEDAYFADKSYDVRVEDFGSVVEPRNEKVDDNALQATVTPTDDWVTVTFYVKTGETAKTYRLEVWSGDREGKKPNAGNTYVMFDGNTSVSSDAETNYDALLSEYADEEDQYKSVFSYFDTDKYLRYNEALDVNGTGNVYRNYDAEAQEEAVFYLHAGSTSENQNFLINYAAQDKVVAAIETDTDDSTTEDDSETTEESTNVWVIISAIAVSALMLLAILLIIFRKIWKKARKNAAKKTRKSKKSQSKRTKLEKVKTEEPKEEIDEDSPYND